MPLLIDRRPMRAHSDREANVYHHSAGERNSLVMLCGKDLGPEWRVVKAYIIGQDVIDSEGTELCPDCHLVEVGNQT